METPEFPSLISRKSKSVKGVVKASGPGRDVPSGGPVRGNTLKQDHRSSAQTTIRATGRQADATDENSEAWLDTYHQGLIQTVLSKDTPGAQRELAAHFSGQLTEDISVLRKEQKDIGSPAQMSGIRATGWTGWARFFLIAAWVIVLIDGLIWFAGGSRVLNFN